MLNVSDINTSCKRAHTGPCLHSITMASGVCGLFLSLEVGSPSHRWTVRQSVDYAILQGDMWGGNGALAAYAWPQQLSSLFRNTRNLPLLLFLITLLSLTAVMHCLTDSLWQRHSVSLCDQKWNYHIKKTFLWLFWMQAVPEISREINFLMNFSDVNSFFL